MKQAGIMLIVKDGLILAISRRYNKNVFGLPGGSYDESLGDRNSMDTAVREVAEETGVKVNRCMQVYTRMEMGDAIQDNFYSTTYYALDWEGDPSTHEEGEVKWLTAEELVSSKAAFGDYNRNMLNHFREMFPEVKLIGEIE